MKRFTLFQWAAALTLVIALAPGAASAQEDGSITISGTFSPYWLEGTVGPDLAEVYANGHEHTWTLTLHGTTQSHSTYSTWFGYLRRATEIHATSFDLEFSGPDAATLNGIVSEHIAGGDVSVYLENAFSSGFGDNFAVWDVSVFGPDVEFWTGELSNGWNTLFPSDADGYPVVGPDPFSIWSEGQLLIDNRPGNDGWIESFEDLVTIEGSVGEPDPGEPVVLVVTDAAVLEGDRGTTWLSLTVTLSRYPDDVVTVDYQTADGSGRNKSDYTATSGTLLFWPDEISRTISIAIKGDRKREADETFSVQLSNAAGATIADGLATATILNDD